MQNSYQQLADVDVAVINSNYALEADLNPTKDAIALEESDSPYVNICLLYTSPSPRDRTRSRMPSSA